jgi:uncharacterized membrane protein (DUF2068 family)
MPERRTHTDPPGLRAVATLEAVKGLVVLLAGFGAFALIHHDVQAVAESLVRHSHLNPARHIPRIFLSAAGKMTDARLWMLAAGALAYSAVRFAESWGLWRARRWAEWLGALSGGIYVPFEVVSLFARPTPLKAVTLLANVAIVAYLAVLLTRGERRAAP